MSMVQLALRRPYTFIVMAMLIVLATPFALLNMATDIFPEINIPVISIVWNYNGLPAQEMGQRISAQNERSLTTTTLTQLDVLRRERGPFEHAVATLTGTPAPVFALAADITELVPPAVPLGVPSDVLERRPDVASAERAMAAANAQIGVAQAAYYPSITLAPSAGYESRALASLFDAPSLLWSQGASIAQPIFSAGRLDANVNFARANYDATVANYRRTVLTAMQEVEDGITGLAALERADAQQRTAVVTARLVLELATARYEGGATSYLDVITAQQALLAAERLAAQLSGQRLLTSVFLIKALGGDWDRPARVAGG